MTSEPHIHRQHTHQNTHTPTMTTSQQKKVVVIGCGLGGLSTAVILAKNGFRVTVLEQESQPGGCLQCFRRDGVKFETGMHFIGSCQPGQPLHTLFEYLEINKDIVTTPLDTNGYNVIALHGRQYRIASGRETFVNSLCEHFPQERKSLEHYYDLVERVAKASPFHSMNFGTETHALSTEYQLKSVDEVLQDCIPNPQLREVLAGTIPLYAAEAGKTPFSAHAFIMDFYNTGAARIAGGSDALVKSMVRTLRKYGGKLLLNTRATQIVCNDIQAEAVLTSDGIRHDADVVIAAIHPRRMLELTPSPLLRNAYRKRIQDIPDTVGAFSVYLRFKPGTVAYRNHNFFGYTTASPWHCENYTEANWPLGFLYMHHAPKPNEDSRYATSGVIISYMRYEEVARWEGTDVEKRGADYEALKQRKAEKLLKIVAQQCPELKNGVASYYTSTPLTYRNYTGTEGGSMYGIVKDVNRGAAFRVHHRTRIPNMYLAGQNVNSHGALGVLVGSMVTCMELLPADTLSAALERIHHMPHTSPKVAKKEACIIGGGLGGLFTGALLATEGYKVMVLEKNHNIGGGLQTFSRKGVTFETGMHVLGGMRKGGSIRKICDYLGITPHLTLQDVPDDCMDCIHYFADGMTYRIPSGRDAFVKALSQYFPDEASGIRRYVDTLYALADEVDFFYLRPDNRHFTTHSEPFYKPADKLIAQHVNNPKLRDLLAYLNPLYGGRAGHTPAYIHALINVLYINGATRFVGGSAQLAHALSDIIQKAGGEVRNEAEVIKVEMNERRVTALVYRHRSTEITLNIDKNTQVINSLHPARLLQLTDSKLFSKAYRMRVEEAENTYSAFLVFVTFKPETFPYLPHGSYFQDDYGMVWNYNDYQPYTFPKGGMYLTPACEQQGAWAEKMIITTIMPYEVVKPWENTVVGQRGSSYTAWKKERTERVLDRMERLYPAFREKIQDVFAASPLTIRDYYGQPQGALYGLFRNSEALLQSQIPVFTKAENLFMTGQNINLHGFCGVPLTAINTVEAILGNGTLLDKINAFATRKGTQ